MSKPASPKTVPLEPLRDPGRRRIATGVLQYPDLAQRHQTLFGLGALFALVDVLKSVFHNVPQTSKNIARSESGTEQTPQN
jgi:hypothetical protein